MKKNYTFKLEPDIVTQIQVRATAEGRSLSNYVEWIFKAALLTAPITPPILIIDNTKEDVRKPKVKKEVIQSIVLNKVEEDKSTIQSITYNENKTEDTILSIAPDKSILKPKYIFEGRVCHYKSYTGQEKELTITDEMIKLAGVPGANSRTFSRFPDASTFAIVSEYLKQ